MSIPFPDTLRAEGQKSIKFVVVGNIPVKVQAEPDSRIRIGGRNLGRATRGAEAIGYDVALTLDRKRGSRLSSVIQPDPSAGTSAATKGGQHTASEPDRTNWMWHSVSGELTVRTNAAWSGNGGLPLAGDYAGQVTITLTPDF